MEAPPPQRRARDPLTTPSPDVAPSEVSAHWRGEVEVEVEEEYESASETGGWRSSGPGSGPDRLGLFPCPFVLFLFVWREEREGDWEAPR